MFQRYHSNQFLIMINLQEISKAEYLKEAISDLFSHIEKANNALVRHKSLENLDHLAIQGFKTIRQQHIDELNQMIMLAFGLQIDNVKIDIGNSQYAMGA